MKNQYRNENFAITCIGVSAALFFGAVYKLVMNAEYDNRQRANVKQEVLSPEQLERRREYHLREVYFRECDLDKNGILEGEESINYRKLPIFSHRFQ